MNAELYAVTDSGYRAVVSGDELAYGERLVSEVPTTVIEQIEVVQARITRAQLLRDTDWTQMPDAPLTPAQRAAMAAYRQALRDLPEQPGFPDCQWPQPPALGEGAASAGTATFP